MWNIALGVVEYCSAPVRTFRVPGMTAAHRTISMRLERYADAALAALKECPCTASRLIIDSAVVVGIETPQSVHGL
jgi:hypothetical protein